MERWTPDLAGFLHGEPIKSIVCASFQFSSRFSLATHCLNNVVWIQLSLDKRDRPSHGIRFFLEIAWHFSLLMMPLKGEEIDLSRLMNNLRWSFSTVQWVGSANQNIQNASNALNPSWRYTLSTSSIPQFLTVLVIGFSFKFGISKSARFNLAMEFAATKTFGYSL